MLNSLALSTGLILDRYFGKVKETPSYYVVRTDDRPGYFWGNYIIMKSPPKKGDLERWISIFEEEIGPRTRKGFMAMTFDYAENQEADLKEFKEYGFKLRSSKVLFASSVHQAQKTNSQILVRPFTSDLDWENYAEIHFSDDWEYGPADEQIKFLQESMEHFKRFASTGKAQRYGAFLNGVMIAELGVYWENGLARFNNVGTHRDYRRQGACTELVYQVSRILLERGDVKKLVMEADETYHAASIYESVGFIPFQKLVTLEWTDRSKPF